MRSSNPVLNNLPAGEYSQQGNSYDADYGQVPEQYREPQAQQPMTIDHVVTNTGITLAVIIALAAVNFGLSLVNPGLAMLLTIAGGIGGFITVLVHAFGQKTGPVTTLIYAAFEGLFVGGISLIFAEMASDLSTGAIIGQAVLGTVGVFAGMLFVYKTGAIRVTPKFTRFITAALIGVAVLALGNLLAAIFLGMSPLRDGGMLAILFSLVCIVLAALSFLQDFDVADKLIRAGAPAKMSWGVALGLAVTLVWLYTEILRLLSYFNRN
ncbi:hypothetical protein C3B44_07590 [Corynebacterium yudongzhengii]|uniref:Bax inhibitor-1/YccA family protein n=1 Tax=Corynebacterium yudongzhengii TaxID=2080740 RepID=A0A2U1T6Q8_9CORY|nr:Bax inhibitor-1/YccA family protein [Corynebacterium yudongzhengii]AWB82235.1 hypothetical protein C3B44_07590 [Corynebacterium yudongzhengii]PWC01684.1 hypothetical protein DF222_06110 [Corynebacterium yudongzhengii]